MMAITLWQPYASLVMLGAKSHEFRTWKIAASLRGQPVVMHAAARKVDAGDIARLRDDLAYGFSPSLGRGDLAKAKSLLDRFERDSSTLPLGAGLGTVVFGDPVRAVDEFMAVSLAAGYDRDDLDPDVWGWPVVAVHPWPEPVPWRGAQGFWRWRGAVPPAAAG